MILMLAEELELNGIKVFYYNTDGITVMCPKDKRHILEDIWKWWEDKTKMSLEESKFSKCYIRDVNNFLNIKENGEVKYKGAYEYTSYLEKYGEFDITGSFEYPIVAYAVSEYLVKGISVEATIKNHRDIYDFCVAKKTGKQFNNLLIEINGINFNTNILQQSIRYYIAKSNYKLYKVKDKSESEIKGLIKKSGRSKINTYLISNENKDYQCIYKFENGKKVYVIPQQTLYPSPFDEWKSYTDVCVGRNIIIFNKYFDVENWEDYKIDYDYYINEANKLIKVLGKVPTVEQLNLFDKQFYK